MLNNNLKIKPNLFLSVILIMTFCYNCIGQNNDNKNIEITGTWRLCKEQHNGMQASRNYCPEVIFFEDGSGTIEFLELPGVFYWKITDDNVLTIDFQSKEESFFYKESAEFYFEIYEEGENLFFLRLSNTKNDDWYLLGKS